MKKILHFFLLFFALPTLALAQSGRFDSVWVKPPYRINGNVMRPSSSCDTVARLGDIRTMVLPYLSSFEGTKVDSGVGFALWDDSTNSSRLSSMPGAARLKATGEKALRNPSGTANTWKVVCIGDSKTYRYARQLDSAVTGVFGFAGHGLDGDFGFSNTFATLWAYPGNVGIVLTSGWLGYDKASDAQHWGICGKSWRGSAGDTLRYEYGNVASSSNKSNKIRLWYSANAKWGSFQVRLNPTGDKSTVNCSLGDSLAYVTYTIPQTPAGANPGSVDLYITDIVDSILIYGIETYRDSLSTGGALVYYLGNSGSTAAQWAVGASYLRKFLSVVGSDVSLVWLGTNDAHALTSATTYYNSMTTVTDSVKAGTTGETILLTDYGEGSAGVTDQTQESYRTSYRAKLLKIAGEKTVSVFDLNRYLPKYDRMYRDGLMADGLHLNSWGCWHVVDGLLPVVMPNYPVFASTVAKSTFRDSVIFSGAGTRFTGPINAGISTSPNDYGIGRFRNPSTGGQGGYVVLSGYTGSNYIQSADSTYTLPRDLTISGLYNTTMGDLTIKADRTTSTGAWTGTRFVSRGSVNGEGVTFYDSAAANANNYMDIVPYFYNDAGAFKGYSRIRFQSAAIGNGAEAGRIVLSNLNSGAWNDIVSLSGTTATIANATVTGSTSLANTTVTGNLSVNGAGKVFTGNAAIRGTGSFTTTSKRAAVYISGGTTTDIYTVSWTNADGTTFPAGTDGPPYVFAKTDSLIVFRGTATISGLGFNYIRMK